ncbi:hypothetical protein OD91_2508 [Lutibacter sp. Hel_I_33_5]|uniref:hypothetical protein n=1 Tax=Lutibacter sp. Hel_I_33_5 TaxID=1566289 RepID=UPI0011A76F1B|nr:hypothetical protein [Lutibacter sp. Hel_I_33_5]TVZ57198.1 hypothetical protein OD91_2508 [Lutibacter sp. Hel_I_33_5]
MKIFIRLLFLLLSTSSIIAQENTNQQNTLQVQFDAIYRTSSSYQDYKVIRKTRFQKLKTDVLDSIKELKNVIQEKEKLILTTSAEKNKLKTEIEQVQGNLDNAISKDNTVNILGINLSKSLYNIIVWGLIFTLLIGLLFFIYRFNNSNVLTRQAKDSLADVEFEFEQHRKKALEREQKVRRQLQDEINKQRGA